jgi:ribosomal protein S18 acetylase RimI-like enzyme
MDKTTEHLSANPIRIEPIDGQYRSWANRLLLEQWGSTIMVTRGRTHNLAELPGFVALIDDKPSGLATYLIVADECELTSLNSLQPAHGVGRALVDAVRQAAETARCRRLWLITTNDNTPALRFYQRLGFALFAVHQRAVDASRLIKPEIPTVGLDGIPIRDEIELELLLG